MIGCLVKKFWSQCCWFSCTYSQQSPYPFTVLDYRFKIGFFAISYFISIKEWIPQSFSRYSLFFLVCSDYELRCSPLFLTRTEQSFRSFFVFIGPQSDHWECLSVTDWLPFSKLDWCDSGLWRCQLKTCWGWYCCWCRWWGSYWQQFVADLEAEVWL